MNSAQKKEKLDYYLVVRCPFDKWQKGQAITDYDEIVKILNGPEHSLVVRVLKQKKGE